MRIKLSTFGTSILLLGFASYALAERTELPYDQLISGSPAFDATVPLDVAFVPTPGDNSPPADTFEGTLYITSSAVATPWTDCNTVIVPGGCGGAYSFPASSSIGLDFVQNGRDLIPVRRDPISLSSSGWWDIVLQPGRVWTERADNGYTRAAIPFALKEKNADCIQNGVMTMLFKTGGSPNISRVGIEITVETCLYNRFDMVGLLSATYTPKPIPNKAAVVSSYRNEVAKRMPTRPISQLSSDFPELGLNLANLQIGDPGHDTLYGLVVALDDTYINYVSNCQTRNGLYPYCDALALPSYSTAKTAYASIALMRLQAMNAASKAQLIAGYVPAPWLCYTQNYGVWSDVSFANALDMATGNYTSSAYEDDENNRMAGLFFSTSNASKVQFAWCNFSRAATPGSTWVYHTSDTYILGRGMQLYFNTLPGYYGKDLFTDLVVADIYTPLGLSQTFLLHRSFRRQVGSPDDKSSRRGL